MRNILFNKKSLILISLEAMKNIEDYLKIDPSFCRRSDEKELRLNTKVLEVDENPYTIPISRDKVRHFKFLILVEERYVEEDTEWKEATNYFGQVIEPLPFHFSDYRKMPTIEQISTIIHRECFPALMATHYPDRNTFDKGFYFVDRDSIRIEDVYVYLKLRHKNYEQTIRFIQDYEHHLDCLYNTLKWWHYLLGDLRRKETYPRWDYPIGSSLLEFISPNEFPEEEVKKIRDQLRRQI